MSGNNLTNGNPEQQKRIDSLHFYLQKRLDISLQIAELRSTRGLAAATALVSTRKGWHISKNINQITNAFQNTEVILLERRKHANEKSEAEYDGFSIIMFVLMTVFIIFLIIAIRKYLYQNEEKQLRSEELIKANKELNTAEEFLKEHILGLEKMMFMTSHKVRHPDRADL